MPYFRNSNRNYNGRGRYTRKRKYTKAEQIAFDMGQRALVSESLKTNQNSRVYDAYCKGAHCTTSFNKKPLF